MAAGGVNFKAKFESLDGFNIQPSFHRDIFQRVLVS